MDSKLFTIEDFLSYQEKLQNSINTDNGEFFFNETMVHTDMVLNGILQVAMLRNEEVKMFCGEFTGFRNEAKNIIDDFKRKAKPDETDVERIDKWNGFLPYETLLETTKLFFDKGGKLTVILEKDLSELSKDTPIWNISKEPLYSGQLSFYKLTVPVSLNHFTIAGTSFRRENSADARTAICSFNSKETTDILDDSFHYLQKLSVPVNVA